MAQPIPGSLSEGAVERSETEGVSSDGCSMPMVYTPAHINSEIFERLRSSNDTPSASLRSAAPSEREPGTMGLHHSTGCSLNRGVAGDFHRPYETQKILGVAIHRGTLPQSASLTAPSEREPGTPLSGRMPFIVPPGNHDVAGDFHRPYEGRFPFNRVLAKIRGFGRFSSPLRKSVIEI